MERRRRLHLIVGAVCFAVASAAVAPVAVAHSDEGKLEVVSVTPSGTTAVITVRLTYGNDGEPVDAATVTVAGDDGAGVRLDPVPMKRTQAAGEYSADVTFPSAGSWNLRVTSVTPAATLTLTQPVTADPGVTAPTTLDAVTSAPQPTDGADRPSSEPLVSPAPVLETADTGTGLLSWVIGAAVLAAIVIAAAMVVSRRRSDDSQTT